MATDTRVLLIGKFNFKRLGDPGSFAGVDGERQDNGNRKLKVCQIS